MVNLIERITSTKVKWQTTNNADGYVTRMHYVNPRPYDKKKHFNIQPSENRNEKPNFQNQSQKKTQKFTQNKITENSLHKSQWKTPKPLPDSRYTETMIYSGVMAAADASPTFATLIRSERGLFTGRCSFLFRFYLFKRAAAFRRAAILENGRQVERVDAILHNWIAGWTEMACDSVKITRGLNLKSLCCVRDGITGMLLNC